MVPTNKQENAKETRPRARGEERDELGRRWWHGAKMISDPSISGENGIQPKHGLPSMHVTTRHRGFP